MITIEAKGDFKDTRTFLTKMQRGDIFRTLSKYGQIGVSALAQNTPRQTGLTAASWTYEIQEGGGKYSIIWSNTNVVNDRPIAVLLQYGHATRNGGWVEGRDYINPALRPIFDKIVAEAWQEVTK